MDTVEEIKKAMNASYRDLAKWLIALSTGAIVFSIKMVTPETILAWKNLLAMALGLLVISIILGVRYVRLTIDATGHNLQKIINEREFDKISRSNPKAEILNDLTKNINEADDNFDKIGNEMVVYFKWQQWLFYLGIALLAFFGIYNL